MKMPEWERQHPLLPRYAIPWVAMGKMSERQRWQVYAMHLTHSAAASHLRSLRATVSELYNTTSMPPPSSAASRYSRFLSTSTTPPVPTPVSAATPLDLVALVDTTESNISKLFVNYIEMLTLKHDENPVQRL